MTIVVKISGKPIERPASCAVLWEALARAAPATDLVIVHGGGRQVDARLAQLGHETTRREGLRVTPPEQIGPIAGVLSGEVNRRLVGVLRARGVNAVGIGLGDGGLIEAEPASPPLGCVGVVTGGDGSVARALGRAGFVPVVSSIGFGPDGGLLNVNADDAAAGVAEVTGAERLVLLTDVPGVLDGHGSVIEELSGTACVALAAAGVIEGGMAVKARAALRAAESCGAEVVVGGWCDAAALIGGGTGGTRIAAGRRRPIAC